MYVDRGKCRAERRGKEMERMIVLIPTCEALWKEVETQRMLREGGDGEIFIQG